MRTIKKTVTVQVKPIHQTKEMRKQAKLASREREMQELRASVARFHKIYLGFQLDREQENLAKIQARIIED